jgi:hypothetical protein
LTAAANLEVDDDGDAAAPRRRRGQDLARDGDDAALPAKVRNKT